MPYRPHLFGQAKQRIGTGTGLLTLDGNLIWVFSVGRSKLEMQQCSFSTLSNNGTITHPISSGSLRDRALNKHT